MQLFRRRRMDTEQADTIDVGIDEKLLKRFNSLLPLANTVVSVAESEKAQKIGDCKKKEPKEGDCYIFNYQEFEKDAKKLSPRMGSEKDAERLKHDFMLLNLNVHLYTNLSYEETFKVLKTASCKDYSQSKYFISCFLTHGGQKGALWAKDKKMNIEDILIIFSKSFSLKGLPKIFIIQACQGKKAELPISTESADSGILTDTQDYPDFLIVNSTYVDTVSFTSQRDKEWECHGSFFIDELCRSLEEFSSNLDLLQILTFVNCRMANMFLSHHKDIKELDNKKQMPCFYSTLKKKVEFNRNIESFVSENTLWFDKRRKRHGSDHDSTKDPLLNRYHIKKAKCVLFLSVIDENIGNEDSWIQRAIPLNTVFACRNYSRKALQNKFKKTKILEFLKQNGNLSGTQESKAKKSSEVDCLICYVAAYSRYDFVCDADGRKISKKEIVETFIGQMNKSFVGKPKIFIFLLCKLKENENLPGERFFESVEPALEQGINIKYSGRQFNCGSDSSDGGTDWRINSIDRGLNANAVSADGGWIGKNLIPIHADILEICITVTDWKQAIGPMDLFREIIKKSPTQDILSLLTEFNCELVEKHEFFQSSTSFSMTSTLTKTLYLP